MKLSKIENFVKKQKDMILRNGDIMFYKKRVTDPDYCVLKFIVESGRYYCDLKTESFEVQNRR